MARSRLGIGISGLLLVGLVGVAATLAGGLTCGEDVQSPEQAPNLCRVAGSGSALWLPMIVGGVVVLASLFSNARIRTVALVTAAVVVGEVGLVVKWVLVSHRTIHY